MKTITNTSEEGIKQLAILVNGKPWVKGDKIRIYVEGGNNYHYDGKWYYDIQLDGTWESKCYLESGYNNSNRTEYVTKHLHSMDESMNEALEGEKEAEFIEVKQNEYQGEPANFGDNEYNYPVNFYNGCGSYYLAILNGKIVASLNYSHSMLCNDERQLNFFKKQLSEKGIEAKVIPADGSGTTFFARKLSDIEGIEYKEYYVPKAGGGKHKNIELILI